MKKFTTQNNSVVYQALDGRCNVFVIAAGKNCILVDASVKRYKKRLFFIIDEFIEKGYSFKALILTHSHFDHAINAYAIKEKYKMKIYIHEEEQACLSQGKNPAVIGAIRGLKTLTALLKKPIEYLFQYEPVMPDIVIGEDKINLNSVGINAYLLYTPGHTIGSMSVIVDDEIAIVGDTMVGFISGYIFPHFATDTGLLITSWEKLINTNCSMFAPAHGRIIKRDTVIEQFNKYRSLKYR